MDFNKVKELLYEENKKKSIEYLTSCQTDEELYVFAYNYNWEDGFEIPQAILDNKNCSLSTSLLIFHLADGMRKFDDDFDSVKLKRWKDFVNKLYKSIVDGKYKKNDVGFIVPMSKVEIYKTKKILNEKELVFVTSIDGDDYNIDL